ncbi:RAB5 [Symbiodinium sp. CCMP2592]|nr:RAB5 [Symbiodinium sp. CCMP2592]
MQVETSAKTGENVRPSTLVFGIFFFRAHALLSSMTRAALAFVGWVTTGTVGGVLAVRTCLLDLQADTFTDSCEPSWAAEDEVVAQCFRECATSQYRLQGGMNPQKPNMAIAEPQTTKCSNQQRPMACPSFHLTCVKPIDDSNAFPNACSGKTSLSEFPLTYGDYYVAFYSFGTASEDGETKPKIVTRIVAGGEICSGTYVISDGGICLGTYRAAMVHMGPPVAPPQPPAIHGMPIPFPELDSNGELPTTSTTTTTTTTTTASTTETTSTAETTSTTASPKKPKGSFSGAGSIIFGILLVLLLFAAGIFFFLRQHRRGDEGRSLATSQEMEMRTPSRQ